MQVAVIFGGAGFIGAHYSRELIERSAFKKIYVYDVTPLAGITCSYRRKLLLDERIHFVLGDVRNVIDLDVPSGEVVSLVVNLAAIHREPGHADDEYFCTNLSGAKNVCEWAGKVGCEDILFTSSIAPYGPHEYQKSEETLPVPTTAYGSSKLVAEQIHRTWAGDRSVNRRLYIVRPGVVFGPSEGGNVSRLVKAVVGGYFCFVGNGHTKKAGIYVKELVSIFEFLRARRESVLANGVMEVCPSMSDFVREIKFVSGAKRPTFSFPFWWLKLVAIVVSPIGLVVSNWPIHPRRVEKLIISNEIYPQRLRELSYQYQFDLQKSLKDWKQVKSDDWE